MATAINANGVIVGNLLDTGESFDPGWGSHTTPVIWRSYTAQAERLSLPGSDWWAEVMAIDDNGYMVGWGRPKGPRPTTVPLIWLPGGQVWQPSIADYPATAELVNPISLHDGTVTFSVSENGRRSFSYIVVNPATAEAYYLKLPNWVEFLSANGWGLETNSKTLVMSGGTTLSLPDLPNATRPMASFSSMSRDGTVIGGYQSVAGEDIVAAVWRCR